MRVEVDGFNEWCSESFLLGVRGLKDKDRWMVDVFYSKVVRYVSHSSQ